MTRQICIQQPALVEQSTKFLATHDFSLQFYNKKLIVGFFIINYAKNYIIFKVHKFV